MKKNFPTTPSSWRFPHPPTKPKNYLKVCRLLTAAQNCAVDVFVEQEVRVWLEACSPGSKRPMHLHQDAVTSTLNRLGDGKWLKWLEQNPVGCILVGAIIRQLKARLQLETVISEQVALSLVARRLIQFVAYGIPNVSAAGIRVHSAKQPMLPPPWGPPATTKEHLRFVLLPTWHDFVRRVTMFWSEDARRSSRLMNSKIEQMEEQELQSERKQRFHLYEPTENVFRTRGPVPRHYVAEMDCNEITVAIAKSRMPCFGAVAAMQSQLAQSFREVPTAIRALKHINSLLVDKLTDSQLRNTALMAIVVMTGVPPQDLLTFGMGQNVSVSGKITELGITINAGSGFYQSMWGRIPQQEILLHMPSTLLSLVTAFIRRYPTADRVSDCFEDHPLDSFVRHMATVGETSTTRVKFLHRAFIYVANAMVQVPPGILALILGRPIGPFRSASNYLSSTDVLIWLEKIQMSLLGLADLSSSPSNWAIPTKAMGVNTPALGDAVITARKTLSSVTNTNSASAALELALAFHGRRPTTDKPCIKASLTHYNGKSALIIADKNSGGGRRLRIVPASKYLEATE